VVGVTYPVARVLAGRGGGDLDVLPRGTSAVIVDHAGVGAAAVGVDLVERHLDLAAGGDLRQLVAGLGHDRLGAGLELVGTGADRLAEGVGGIAPEAGAVLLEGVSPGSVAGSGGVNAQSHAAAAGIAGCADDGTVAGDQAGQEGGDDEGLERHVADWEVIFGCWSGSTGRC